MRKRFIQRKRELARVRIVRKGREYFAVIVAYVQQRAVASRHARISTMTIFNVVYGKTYDWIIEFASLKDAMLEVDKQFRDNLHKPDWDGPLLDICDDDGKILVTLAYDAHSREFTLPLDEALSPTR